MTGMRMMPASRPGRAWTAVNARFKADPSWKVGYTRLKRERTASRVFASILKDQGVHMCTGPKARCGRDPR